MKSAFKEYLSPNLRSKVLELKQIIKQVKFLTRIFADFEDDDPDEEEDEESEAINSPPIESARRLLDLARGNVSRIVKFSMRMLILDVMYGFLLWPLTHVVLNYHNGHWLM